MFETHEFCKITQVTVYPTKTTYGYCYMTLSLQVIRFDTSQSIPNKHLFIDPMLPVHTKRKALPFLNWEISLTFVWTELRYLVIFNISRNQLHFWSASRDIDVNTPICDDTENLAKTFIGKLFSTQSNSEQEQINS